MFPDSSSIEGAAACAPLPRSGSGASCCAQSRLVIRDESKPSGKPLVSDESFVGQIDPDYESEIYRIEVRRGHGVLTAHPIPLESANPRAAHIDWCAFTVKTPQFKTHLWVMNELARLFGFGLITPRNTGLYGYKHSAIIHEAGLIAWGGKNQRGTVYVSINAQGCARINDWEKFHTWCVCHKARLTRLDLAHDDFEGKVVSIERAKAWYDAGGFNAGGRKPATRLAGDWWGLMNGRTVYIGERANGKLTRVYEKGKQQGDPESAWTRIEVELHNKSRVIPLDALTRPAAYLAGAYPCLRYLSAEQCKIKTIQKAANIAYTKVKEVLRTQHGKFVNLMMHVTGGDAFAVVKALVRDGYPARFDAFSYHLRVDSGLLHSLDQAGASHAALVT